MLNSIAITQIYVLDQDQALDFYVGKLGLEVTTDADLGFMRWLTVARARRSPTGRSCWRSPGRRRLSEETAAQVRELLTKGAAGGHLFFRCDDAYKTHAELKARGVEITEEPVDRGYGIDFGLRDPFGNHIRIGQMKRRLRPRPPGWRRPPGRRHPCAGSAVAALYSCPRLGHTRPGRQGAVAQLVAHHTGSVGVRGSSPLSSTHLSRAFFVAP